MAGLGPTMRHAIDRDGLGERFSQFGQLIFKHLEYQNRSADCGCSILMTNRWGVKQIENTLLHSNYSATEGRCGGGSICSHRPGRPGPRAVQRLAPNTQRRVACPKSVLMHNTLAKVRW